MSDHKLTNAQRFMSAFADIERLIRNELDAPYSENFGKVLARSKLVIPSQRDKLTDYAKLRNAIAHSNIRHGKLMADPRDDVVADIEKLLETLRVPPLVRDVLADHTPPTVLAGDAPLSVFLDQVVQHSFSQAPVKTTDGTKLITTNAVARWFASQDEAHRAAADASLSDVLEFAEPGDRVKFVHPDISAVQAIYLLSGGIDCDNEPPAALLLGNVTLGKPPQLLVTRADLSAFYAALSG